MERSLNAKGQFQELAEVMSEYFESDHAELVPELDLDNSPTQVFYLPCTLCTRKPVIPQKLELYSMHQLNLPLEYHLRTHC